LNDGAIHFRAGAGTMHDVSRPHDFERSDADPRLISALAVGVAAFLIATPFLLQTLYPDARHLGRIPDELPQPPPPRLQIEPQGDLDRLHTREDRQLTGFSWIDRGRQVAHIPIEEAMKLVRHRGLAGWASPSTPSARQAPP
jgi:hypothetical protein